MSKFNALLLLASLAAAVAVPQPGPGQYGPHVPEARYAPKCAHTPPGSSGLKSADCRCFPGDACWPSEKQWDAFNHTIGGRLVATVPLAAPCHNDDFTPYDKATCTTLQDGWLQPQTQYIYPPVAERAD